MIVQEYGVAIPVAEALEAPETYHRLLLNCALTPL